MPNFEEILKWLKDSVSPLGLALTTAATCAVILFIPPSWGEHIGLVGFRAKYADTVGAAFVFSLCAVVFMLLVRGVGWLKTKSKEGKAAKEQVGSLSTLTEHEKGLLLLCFINSKRQTCEIDTSNQVAWGLVKRNILYLPTATTRGHVLAYTMHAWAWDYINKHPEIVSVNMELLDEEIKAHADADPRI